MSPPRLRPRLGPGVTGAAPGAARAAAAGGGVMAPPRRPRRARRPCSVRQPASGTSASAFLLRTSDCPPSSGTTIHRIAYATAPIPFASASSTAATRTIVGSMSKYSASPPHTPAIIRSVRLRYSRFSI